MKYKLCICRLKLIGIFQSIFLHIRKMCNILASRILKLIINILKIAVFSKQIICKNYHTFLLDGVGLLKNLASEKIVTPLWHPYLK